jgi:plastocyanin
MVPSRNEKHNALSFQDPFWYDRPMTGLLRFFVPIALFIPLWAAAAGEAAAGKITGVVLIHSEPATRAVVYLLPLDAPSPPFTPVEKTIIQENLRFIPDFLVVPAGTILRFKNHDNEIHNIHSKALANRFDTGAHPPGTVKTVTLKNPGTVPLRCRIHQEMRGLIYVAPSPYFSMTDPNGRFEIPSVPPGRYRITAWHPRLTPEELARGTMELNMDSEDQTVQLRLSAEAPPGTDLTEASEQDWPSVVEQIRDELARAVALWKNGSVTAATAKVMSAHSRLYGESGLREAITQRLGRARADEHEQRLDRFRKRIQGIGEGKTTEALLQKEADRIVNDLMRDAEQMKTTISK